jgi:hypothetical protein
MLKRQSDPARLAATGLFASGERVFPMYNNMHVAYTSFPKLRCVFCSAIIRNQSLQIKYPGGLEAFTQNFAVQSNDRISVYNDMGSDIGDLLMILHQFGMKEFQDFTTLDTVDSEMWCCAKPEMRKRPFAVDTQVGWLKGQFWKGNVWVWFCG